MVFSISFAHSLANAAIIYNLAHRRISIQRSFASTENSCTYIDADSTLCAYTSTFADSSSSMHSTCALFIHWMQLHLIFQFSLSFGWRTNCCKCLHSILRTLFWGGVGISIRIHSVFHFGVGSARSIWLIFPFGYVIAHVRRCKRCNSQLCLRHRKAERFFCVICILFFPNSACVCSSLRRWQNRNESITNASHNSTISIQCLRQYQQW